MRRTWSRICVGSVGLLLGCGESGTEVRPMAGGEASVPPQLADGDGDVVTATKPIDGACESSCLGSVDANPESWRDAIEDMDGFDLGGRDAICRPDGESLDSVYWVEPCPSSARAVAAALTCLGYAGARIYSGQCGQRQLVRWDWTSHGMACYYEGESLVGVKVRNDVVAFCNNTSPSMEMGSVEDCSTSNDVLVLDCRQTFDL
jgi:hypothetical protein